MIESAAFLNVFKTETHSRLRENIRTPHGSVYEQVRPDKEIHQDIDRAIFAAIPPGAELIQLLIIPPGWTGVIPLLQAQGYNVLAVQNPLSSFEDDVNITRQALASLMGVPTFQHFRIYLATAR